MYLVNYTLNYETIYYRKHARDRLTSFTSALIRIFTAGLEVEKEFKLSGNFYITMSVKQYRANQDIESSIAVQGYPSYWKQ